MWLKKRGLKGIPYNPETSLLYQLIEKMWGVPLVDCEQKSIKEGGGENENFFQLKSITFINFFLQSEIRGFYGVKSTAFEVRVTKIKIKNKYFHARAKGERKSIHRCV